jgi:transaldolase
VGGDVVLTMPYSWQVRFNGSGIAPEARIDTPVDQHLVDDLAARIPDFVRAYEPNGLRPDEFAGYGAAVRTLRGFVQSYHDLQGVVRDIMMPNPDVKGA